MKTNKYIYGQMWKKVSPPSKKLKDFAVAFAVGGGICVVGQALLLLYGGALGFPEKEAGTLTSVTLIVMSALCTGFGFYDKLARHAGAGTLVPITGFANAVVSPALEFKTEGFVLGTGAKMFIIAGPVIVYGVAASAVAGTVLWIIQRLAA